jgi:hypothetical protein
MNAALGWSMAGALRPAGRAAKRSARLAAIVVEQRDDVFEMGQRRGAAGEVERDDSTGPARVGACHSWSSSPAARHDVDHAGVPRRSSMMSIDLIPPLCPACP